MPPVIAFLASEVVAGWIVTWGQVAYAAMAIGSIAYSQAEQRKAAAQAKRDASKAEAQGRQHTLRSSTPPRRLIYGEIRVAGSLVFFESTGAENKYLHLVLVMAGHEVSEIGDIYLDDKALNSSHPAYANVRVNKHLGSATQVADADLVRECSRWTDRHNLYGLAYVYVRLAWNHKVFANGLPEIRAIIKGKKVYDPRTLTTNYSNNWALCVRDYLSADYGVRASDTEIDDDMIIAAANVSDEVVEQGELADLETVAEQWDFQSTDEGFTTTNATLTATSEYVVLAATATDPQLRHAVSFNGGTNRFVRIKIQNVVSTAWQGIVYYSTSGHGESALYSKKFSEPEKDGEFHFIELDMHDLDAGGDDWKNSTITNIRLDFDNADTGITNIDSIQIGGRSTQERYQCNGSMNLYETAPADGLDSLLTAGVGSLCFTQGVYKLRAGAYGGSAGTLDENNLRGGVKLRPRPPRTELANAIKGTFVSPADEWNVVEFPTVENTMYVTEDGGKVVPHDIDLPFTTDAIASQRIAKIHLERSRQAMVLEFPANYTAMKFIPGDVVAVSIALLGFSSKLFRILEWSLAEDGGGVDLVMQEEAPEVYDWNGGAAAKYDPAPDTILDDPTVCEPPINVNVVSGNDQLMLAGDGTILARMEVTWDAPTTGMVLGYEVEWQKVGEPTWQQTPSTDTSATLGAVSDGDRYNVRVRTINILNIRSSWITFFNHTVIGKTERPPAPSTFLVTRQPDGTREFNATYTSKPVDFAGYRIYYKLGSGQVLPNMDLLNGDGLLTAFPFESNQLAAGDYTFALTAVDTSGLESDGTYINSTLADPRIGSVAYSEYPASTGWLGTKTDCFVNYEGFLEAESNTTWDTAPASWGIYPGWNDGAKSPIVYEHTEIDLGVDLTFTPLLSISGTGTPTFDVQWKADGGAYSAWETPSLVTARYLKVRVSVAGTTPLIQQLNILLSAAVITEEINDLDTSTLTGDNRIAVGDIRLPITKDFNVITQVQLALQSVGAGWTWEIIDKDTTIGARVKIYNSSGVLADATIDAFLRGL